MLGYINPDTYYGGRMPLNRERAERAVREKIAEPMGLPVEEAAALIRHIVDANMSSAIKREIHLRGYHPEDFALFAFGGAGPTHVSGFLGDLAGAVIFQTAPVFCALGSSIMDIVHVYETSRRMLVMAPMTQELTTEYEVFNGVVDQLMKQARADLAAEGLPADRAEFSLELDMLYGGQVNVKRTACPVLHLRSPQDVQALYDAFEREFSEAFSPLVVNKPGGVYLDNFVLKVTVPTAEPALPDLPLEPADAGAARTGQRPAWWPGQGWTETSALRRGRAAAGPPARRARPSCEAPLTTVVVPPGMRTDRPARPRPAEGRRRPERRRAMIPTLEQKLAWLKLAPVPDRTALDARRSRPGDYEIGFQRTNDILDEGMEVFVRSCRSAMGIAGDSLVGIFTADGDMVNGSCGTYLHAVIPPLIIKYILHNYGDNPGIRDGDLWFANDAVYGGIHNPDQMVAMPVFFTTASSSPGPRRWSTPPRPARRAGRHAGRGHRPLPGRAEPAADQDRRELPAARRHRRPVQGVRHPRAADDHGRPQGTLHDGRPGAHPASSSSASARAPTSSSACSGGCCRWPSRARGQAHRLLARRQVPLRQLRRRGRHRAGPGPQLLADADQGGRRATGRLHRHRRRRTSSLLPRPPAGGDRPLRQLRLRVPVPRPADQQRRRSPRSTSSSSRARACTPTSRAATSNSVMVCHRA